MRLLVSASNAADAAAAVAGGAHIIDAKDPRSGPLGAVTADVFASIGDAVAGRRLLSAALGDAGNDAAVARLAGAFVRAGASFVKVGFANDTTTSQGTLLLRAIDAEAQRHRVGTTRPGVIGVAYADHSARALSPMHVIEMAVEAGVAGVLLDTADKQGPRLPQLMAPQAIAAWVRAASDAGLVTALAGQLTADDFPVMRATGADIVGVRGAACDYGRQGCVVADKVSLLRSRCNPGAEAQRRAEA